MSWLQKLYETFEACQSDIGVMLPNRTPLLPIYHTTQLAQIEAAVDLDGNWCNGRGSIVEKVDATTILPCTERSGSRTSKPEPHALFDKLQYVAGDFCEYGEQKRYAYPAYLKALTAWCDSPYGHAKVRAVLRYLQQGTLMRDLIADKLLYCAQDGTVPEKWVGGEEETPPIFKVCTNQLDAFVRFRVMGADDSGKLWEDPSVWESWIQYQNTCDTEQDLCCVLGRKMVCSELSPKKIRNSGDGAKLISSNDTSGFTFRGRFSSAQEAVSIGRETTEKAHNALRWLISRQAYVNGEQVVLAWAVKTQLPKKMIGLDSLDLDSSLEDFSEDEAVPLFTGQEFADRFSKALAGYRAKLSGGEEAAIIGLDSATPGRLSIFYYRELQAHDLLDRVQSWHTSCSWLHRYRTQQVGTDEKGKPVYKGAPFIGAPSPKDIIETAFGARVDDKLRKSTMERLLPCIIDAAKFPEDIMRCAVRRATNGAVLEKRDAEKALSIACALVRKYYNGLEKREVWKLALNETEKDRSYLFGRALAYARKLEEIAQRSSGNEARQTNAERMQVAFTQHPAHIWEDLFHKLLPYLTRLRTKGPWQWLGAHYEQELYEVISMISKEDFTNEPLTPLYLLGYACQMNKFMDDAIAAKEASELKKAAVVNDGKDGE